MGHCYFKLFFLIIPNSKSTAIPLFCTIQIVLQSFKVLQNLRYCFDFLPEIYNVNNFVVREFWLSSAILKSVSLVNVI